MPKTTLRYDDALDRYLRRVEGRGHSAQTLRVYSAALRRLGKWMVAEGHPNLLLTRVEPDLLDDYFFTSRTGLMRDGKLSANTHNNYRSYISSFFRWAVQMRLLDSNPMDGVGTARPDQRRAHLILSPSEMLDVLDHATGPRDRAIIVTGMHTGLRSIDLKMLKVGDVNLITGTLSTEIRKTRQNDDKPITSDLAAELYGWLAEYGRLAGLPVRDIPNDWPMFPSLNRSGFDGVIRLRSTPPQHLTASMTNIVSGALERAGFPTGQEGFHTLRRSAARAMFEALQDDEHGRDRALLIVKDFLNHASTAQTEKYLGLSHERHARDRFLRGRSFLVALAAEESNNTTNTTAPIQQNDDIMESEAV